MKEPLDIDKKPPSTAEEAFTEQIKRTFGGQRIHLFEDGRIVVIYKPMPHAPKPFGIAVIHYETRYLTKLDNRFATIEGVTFFAYNVFGPMDWNIL